jgi:hypothetical protein
VTRGGKVEDGGGRVDQREVVRGTGCRGVIEVICFPEGNGGAIGVGKAVKTRGGP